MLLLFPFTTLSPSLFLKIALAHPSTHPSIFPTRYFARSFAKEYCKIGCLAGANVMYDDTVTNCAIGTVAKDCRCDPKAPTNDCVKGRLLLRKTLPPPIFTVAISYLSFHVCLSIILTPKYLTLKLVCVIFILNMLSHFLLLLFTPGICDSHLPCAKAVCAQWPTGSECATRRPRLPSET